MTRDAGPGTTPPGPSPRVGAGEEVLADLVRRSAEGDQQAFAALYDAVAPRAYGLALRVVRDPDLAADVTQEALLDAWRGAAGFRPERGSVTGWVCSITHRRAVDLVRSTQSRRDRELRAGAASFGREHDDVAEAVADAEDRRRVVDCLGTLTALEQEAVTAAYYGGLTYREVADRLGAKLATVKSRMRTGLRRLLDCLGVE
ncbi:sigma-70 family RNA polymerase sigma factor [Citricoccus sp. SGAir0253]|uniref:ECF RNA polymerase sigma factor SigK n=1 Tax=Citricoccus sp. SGAir0253 TaxID=2567881 RepID=UPI0010CCE62E|nr:ECF RNA polymerase sigma factor SigK [Citricoccus sp. SGAir0253]QCU79044.1 sigma-70 family RNA polymerase sigma factor [Citricoccus sp. SGAir0253]